MRIRTITIVVLALLMSSCASIIHGPTQRVNFNSQPSGASILIDGKDLGNTPRTIGLKRNGRFKGDKSKKTTYDVKITLDGYHPYEIKINRDVDGWLFGNILIGGLIGIIIDASTGAMYRLTPNQVMAQMNSKTTGLINRKDDEVYVAVTMEIDPNWKKIGKLNQIE